MESPSRRTPSPRARPCHPARAAAVALVLGVLASPGCDREKPAAPGAQNQPAPAVTDGTPTGSPGRTGGSDAIERRVEPKAVAMLDKYLSLLDSPANAGVKEMTSLATLDIGMPEGSPTLTARWTPAGAEFTARMPGVYDEMMPPEMVAPMANILRRLIGDRFVGPLLTSLLPDIKDYEVLYRESEGRPFVKLFAARPGPVWERLEIQFDEAGLISGMTGTTRTDKDDPITGAYGGASNVRIEAAHSRSGELWRLSKLRIVAIAGEWDAEIHWCEGASKPAVPAEIRYINSLVPGDRRVMFPEWIVDGRPVRPK